MNRETAYYVVCYFGHLMTDVERRAYSHLVATMKTTFGRSDAAAQEQAWRAGPHRNWMTEDPRVLNLAAGGYDAFVERTATRIVAERGDKVQFNRCPQCGGLARTPTVKQCRFCGHDWHGRA